MPYLARLHRYLAAGARYHAEQLRAGLAAVQLPGTPLPVGASRGAAADGIWYNKESQPDIEGGSIPPEPTPAAQSGLVAKVATSRMRGYQYVTTQVPGVYAIKEVIAGVPDTCRCLFLHILSRPPVVLVAALKDAPGSFVIPGRSLKEVHLMFVDGTIYRLQIGDPGAKVSMEPPSKKVSFEDTHLPEESIVRQRLLPLWSNLSDPHKKAQDLFAYVKRLIDLSGVDLEVFLGRLSSDPRLGAQYGSGGLRWEDLAPKGQGASLPFSLLSILAEYCREDVRRHIIVSDSRHFQQWWKPELWGTEHYPFYLEAEDIAVLEYFSRQQGDAYRRTFGWLLLSGRKDPFNYHNYADLMGTLGLPQEAIVALETNQAIPELTTVLRLSNELDTPMPQWVDALKRTFSREQLPHWVTEFRPTAKTRS
jgi:hypothetical protein